MKPTMATTLVLAALTLGALFGSAADGSETRFEGTLVTTGCHLKGRKSEPAHKECAMRCTERGIPAGIVTSEGKFYPLMLPTENVAPYMEEKVRVTGDLRKGMIFVSRFEVHQGSDWREVPDVIF